MFMHICGETNNHPLRMHVFGPWKYVCVHAESPHRQSSHRKVLVMCRTLVCRWQTFRDGVCFCKSCKQTHMFCVPLSFILPWGKLFPGFVYRSAACTASVLLAAAAYFTIYTSVLLFRQRPTFSACFSSLPRFSAQIIAHLKWPIFQYLAAEPLFSFGVFILSRLVQMSFGSGASQRRC